MVISQCSNPTVEGVPKPTGYDKSVPLFHISQGSAWIYLTRLRMNPFFAFSKPILE